jgi:tetratricopeptide (TPR) repeat protein
MKQNKTRRLLNQMAWRLRLVSVGNRFHLFALVLAGVYLAVLLVSRFLGLIPNVFHLVTLAVVPVTALVLAAMFHRRYSLSAAARSVDEKMSTKDLFLTASMIESAPGEYKLLVVEDAEKQAGSVVPHTVAPFRWLRPAGNLACAHAVLILAVLYLPQFDPFGKEEHRKKIEDRANRLEDTKKAVVMRSETLTAKQSDDKESEADKALKELLKTFQEFKPLDKEGNLKRMQDHQKELGKMWRDLNEQKLKNALNDQAAKQAFGMPSEKHREWKEGMEKGDMAGLQDEMKRLQDVAKQLSDMPDGADKERLKDQLQRDLQQLRDFMAREMNSQPMDAALARALEQLALADTTELADDAMKALAESMNLSQRELQNLAESLKDLQNLEEALKTLQMAKQLNEQGDGHKCDQPGNCPGSGKCSGLGQGQGQGQGKVQGQGLGSGSGKTIADYAKLYEQLLAQGRGDGDGTGNRPGMGGMGGPGQGRGGKAPEDDSITTGFKSEKEKTQLLAGKILMQMKTKGLSDPGKANEQYLQSVRDVRQGVSEAIVQEQVPPAYHDAIQKYFDSLEKTDGEPTSTSPSAP